VVVTFCNSSSAPSKNDCLALTTPKLRSGRAVETLDVGMRNILYTVMGYYKKDTLKGTN
jgi:hypothetical protein